MIHYPTVPNFMHNKIQDDSFVVTRIRVINKNAHYVMRNAK